ncbi:MAG: EAL domain-containing protein, partial [Xanthobacteraceae bacterium]|nr:EAL domain-containing protein [Xanthobacteraceae bacterium]
MVLIAASAGAVLYLLIGLNASESMIVGIAVLTGLAIYNAVTSRPRDRSDLGAQISDLSRGTGNLTRQVAELGRRTAAMEGQSDKIIDDAAEKTRAATKSITGELAELGTLVKQLSETVALHELKFSGAGNLPAAPRNDSPRLAAESPGDAAAAAATAADSL